MKKLCLLENKLISIVCILIYITNTPLLAVSNSSLIDSKSENSTNVSEELKWYPTSESPNLLKNEVIFNLPFSSNRESRSKQSSAKLLNSNLNDLVPEASSNVEKRNKKVNRSSSQQKSRTTSKSSSKKRQNSKLVRTESSKYNNRNNYNNLRIKLLPYSAYQQRLFYRTSARDKPIKFINPKVFFYDFDDYYDYYDDRNRLRADYDSREEDVSKESLEDLEDKASVEATTEDDSMTTESTTTEKNENSTIPSYHGYGYGYGPSHGHEHVSFTYGPNFNDNYWHGQQQFSDNFNYNPYLAHFKK